jgi:hypothetical protein
LAVTLLLADFDDFSPVTPLAQGLARFADWFKGYYGYD